VRAVANVAAKTILSTGLADADGWIEVGTTDLLDREDILRFDYAQRTFAVYRSADDQYYASDGVCTHGNTHLATGMVKGCLIECPKHNGRFDVRDGSPQRRPVCIPLRTYPVEVADGRIRIRVLENADPGQAATETTYTFRVLSNENVATFIKELIVEAAEDSPTLSYLPGQYVQVNVPAYGEIPFRSFHITAGYEQVWELQHVFDYKAQNHTELRRNFSLACNPETDKELRFNVRISTPPRGQDCSAGVGTTYLWNLKQGDTITAVGPFGDFLVKQSDREMVYLGGGAGMAPLRSHLSYLFETLNTGRKVSYWYGSRSRQEMFYQDYFAGLAQTFENFTFHAALSEPLPEDNWTSHAGNIHDVLRREYLQDHRDPGSIEYYLCGPQPMIQAARAMLEQLGVDSTQVAFDEF
jgi:Na+-transporting NADH:ubiquinone oxidoreductase subunit F